MERYAILQARQMAQRGHQIVFLRRAGAPVDRELSGETLFGGMALRPIKYIDLRAMALIRGIIRGEGVEIVHAHHSADLGLIVPALWGAPGVRLIFSNYMWAPGPKNDFYHRMEYGRVERVLVSCSALKDNTVENLPVAAERVEVLPYGIDMARFNPQTAPKGALRGRYGFGPEIKLVGVISKLDPVKGQMEMIEAMPAILAAEPNARLILTGDETEELKGKYKHVLEEKVAKLGLGERVIFTGITADTASILADLEVFALPSPAETFALACLEAMAMERAIVGTDAWGTPEMLAYGAAGLLAKPGSPEALAQKTITLLKDPGLRHALGARARQEALGKYDLNVVMERLDAIYRD
jgi:hypothetical protein